MKESMKGLPLPVIQGSITEITNPGLYSLKCQGMYKPVYYEPPPPTNPLEEKETVLLEFKRHGDGSLYIAQNRCPSLKVIGEKPVCEPLALARWKVIKERCPYAPETFETNSRIV